jgi:DNA helicase-2/ATP-dependent DNA helicase PcrA
VPVSTLLDGLNPMQRAAAAVIDGAVLVLAGAGSGKTRVLTRRIAHLVEQGVPPWRILSVTFTNKAAAEMKERVAHLIPDPDKARRVMVSTFHSSCVRFLREDIDKLGYTKQFTIFDDDDQRSLMKQLAEEQGVGKSVNLYEVRSAIDRAKNSMISPEQMAADESRNPGDPTPKLYAAYQQRLRAANAVDFNDIINLVVQLWEEHPDVLAKYRQRFQYLLVDEYQDTNRAQYRLIELLTGPPGGTGNVMVVGDDDQSIYGFRGADIRNILDFKATFPDAQIIRLEQNYRSRGNILRAANAVVKNNRERMDKTLWTEQDPGEPIALLVGQDEPEEAELIKERMQRFARDGRRWGEMAVIYRTNAASRAFEQALTLARIPHVLVGAKKFYERKEVKDLIAYLKLLLNPADPMAFERVVNTPRRGVGPKLMDDLRAQAERDGVPLLEAARRLSLGSGRGTAGLRAFIELMDSMRDAMLLVQPSALVQMVLREGGYAAYLRDDEPDRAEDRLRNVDELMTAIAAEADAAFVPGSQDPLERLQAFLDQASLAGQSDELPDEDGRGKVTLLTAHLAKGLEYPIVFVVGMQEGGFPHYRARESEKDIEEERRLVYVAFTRAMEHLTLSRARRRLVMGRGFEAVEPSRFLHEVPRDLLRLAGDLGLSRPAPPAEDRAARAARLGFGAPVAAGTGFGALAARAPTSEPSPAPIRRPAAPPMPGTAGPPELTRAPPPPGAHRTRSPERAEDFAVGARVLHPSFGAGTIKKREGSASNLKLNVQFDGVGPKVLFALRANLELLLD